jgi:hypothetical protein
MTLHLKCMKSTGQFVILHLMYFVLDQTRIYRAVIVRRLLPEHHFPPPTSCELNHMTWRTRKTRAWTLRSAPWTHPQWQRPLQTPWLLCNVTKAHVTGLQVNIKTFYWNTRIAILLILLSHHACPLLHGDLFDSRDTDTIWMSYLNEVLGHPTFQNYITEASETVE